MANTDDKDKKIGEVPHLTEVTGKEKIPVSASGEPRYIEVEQIREGLVTEEEAENKFVPKPILEEGDSEDMDYGYIVLVNNETSNKFKVHPDNYEKYDKDKYTPIGVIVVPTAHDVYGTRECGIMALRGASTKNPNEGATADSTLEKIYFGDTKVDIDGVDRYTGFVYVGINSVTNQIQGYYRRTCYLASMRLVSEKANPYDPKTGYRQKELTIDKFHYVPSPYNKDESRNNLYYYSETKESNAFSTFDGKGITEKIIKKAVMQPNWETDSLIKNSNETGYYPAACCCWRYYTKGTKQGDWYLPSIAELGYYAARDEFILQSFEKISISRDWSLAMMSCNLLFLETGNECGSYFPNSQSLIQGTESSQQTIPFTRLNLSAPKFLTKSEADKDYAKKEEVNEIRTNQEQDLSKITELQGKLNGVDNLSDELAKIPTLQNGVNGNEKNYIYSDPSIQGKGAIAAARYRPKENGRLAAQYKYWGDADFNHNTEFPQATATTDGVMSASDKAKLDTAPTDIQGAFDNITEKIPSQASSTNQLADKDFVNSSIATNTAEFKGTHDSLESLQAISADANDYGFVKTKDSDGNTVFKRYKYVEGAGWVWEYDLNNSSFTANQWAAIQSGITSGDVTKIAELDKELETLGFTVETINQGLGQLEKDAATKEELKGYLLLPPPPNDGKTYAIKNGQYELIAEVGRSVVDYDPVATTVLEVLDTGVLPVLDEETLTAVRTLIGEEIFSQLEKPSPTEIATANIVEQERLIEKIETAKKQFIMRKAQQAALEEEMARMEAEMKDKASKAEDITGEVSDLGKGSSDVEPKPKNESL